MSKYFRTLERLKNAEAIVEPALGEAEQPASPAPPLVTRPPIRELLLSEHAPAYASLLESVRARVASSGVPRIVIAPVSGMESAEPVLAGLMAQARERGVRLLAGSVSVSRGQRVLSVDTSSEGGISVPPFVLGQRVSAERQGLQQWLEHASVDQDLVAFLAPPLSTSVEALLLGKHCDGLLVVAQSSVTQRQDLVAAVDKAKSAGSNILGLVMTGASGTLPKWLRQLLPSVRSG